MTTKKCPNCGGRFVNDEAGWCGALRDKGIQWRYVLEEGPIEKNGKFNNQKIEHKSIILRQLGTGWYELLEMWCSEACARIALQNFQAKSNNP